MPRIFMDVSQVELVFEGYLHNRELVRPTEEALSQIPSFAQIMLEILMAIHDQQLTLVQLLRCLPEDYQPKGGKCTADALFPLITALICEGRALPAYFRWSLFNGDEGSVTNEAPVKTSSTALSPVWGRLRRNAPSPPDDFFRWLRGQHVAAHMNWGAGVDTLESQFKRHKKHDQDPVDFMGAMVPTWDGVNQVTYEDVQTDIKEGFVKAVANVILPGLAEIIPKLPT